MRVHVTGNAGSGKSTLAARLGTSLGLPVKGMDQIVWMPGWEKTPTEKRAVLEKAMVSERRWVIDGVSPTVRKVADVVIFLDVGRPTAFYRCAKRNWRYLFRSRPGLPPGCPELLIIPRLAHLIWNFPNKVKPQIVADMEQATGRYFHVTNANELSAALRELGVH